MRNGRKLKNCVKITLIANAVAVFVFLLIAAGDLFKYVPPMIEVDEESLHHGSKIEEFDDSKVRSFILQRDHNEREIRFENLKPDKVPRSTYELVSFESKGNEPVRESVVFKQTYQNLKHKLIHLDLKGAPPKINYLKSLLVPFKNAGATGLLIEYEDMFPYDSGLGVVKALNSYDPSELADFLEMARDLDLEVIPLVQTFGHLEYLLKLAEFRDLREVDAFPDSICPSDNRSLEIITNMIEQVIAFHSKIADLKWIHLGCDEVYHINQCSKCLRRNTTSQQIFIDHVSQMASIAKKNRPNLNPLIWDDMLRSFKPNELKSSGLGDLVQPVVWIYTSSIKSLVPDRIWYTYATTFSGIWVASAFKGASGSTAVVPKLAKNYENNLAWMNFVTNYKVAGTSRPYDFRGIVLTGWSRYEHFSVLCETLPISIPSLMLNLFLVNAYVAMKDPRFRFKTWHNIHTDIFKVWADNLHCRNIKTTNIEKASKRGSFTYLTSMEDKLHTCNFQGNHFYADVKNLASIEDEILRFHVVNAYRMNGFLYYNVLYGSTNEFRHKDVVEKARKFTKDLKAISNRLRSHMTEFFDEYTIKELIEFKIDPLKDILDRVLNASERFNSVRVWKKRPFS